MVGICLLSQPEIAAGAVIILGTVVVAVAIKEELSRASSGKAKPATASTPEAPLPERSPAPTSSPLGRDWLPPPSSEPPDRNPKCQPIPGPPRGGNEPHNQCADNIPHNGFPGLNVLVNGKHFDALQLATRTLWEVKTDNFDKHSPRSQDFFIRMKLPEIQREATLARECGYNFVVGVRSAAHKAALERMDETLTVVVMDWC